MTTAIALQRLKGAVLRDDLDDRYIDFLNEAIRHIATRHSFLQMKTAAAVTIHSGYRSVTLPALFKEFQNGRYPAVAALPAGDESGSGDSGSGDEESQPIPVYSRQEIAHLPPSFRPNPHLTFFQENGIWTLKYPERAPFDIPLTVYIYVFPDELVDTNDSDEFGSGSGEGDASTPLLEEYPDLILEKAMAIAFQSIGDPLWQDHDKQFEELLPDAIQHDISRSMPMAAPEKE